LATYKKLVRDRIPEIIEASGRKPVVEVLGQEEYVRELRRKLQEEVQEYLGQKMWRS
jgi:predicted house-cleaning noncanonical NTP pyrophosphatase (MazG superfamily)